MTTAAVVLGLMAGLFTAVASVAQRRAAAPAPAELSLRPGLVGYLLHRPVWFLGITAMVLGFIFQVNALRVGTLSVVQPLVATELVIVFGLIASKDRGRVQGRDWVSAAGIVVGLAGFLAVAHPEGGSLHADSTRWIAAAAGTTALAALAAVVAFARFGRGHRSSSNRRAAFLGVAAATGFGFVAAVVKELSTHLHQGFSAVISSWAPYALLLAGSVSMLLASSAFQAGSLAASQPALTLVDPIVASALGVLLFGDRIDLRPFDVLGEMLAVSVVIISVIVLSRSPLIQEDSEFREPDAAPAVESGDTAPPRIPVRCSRDRMARSSDSMWRRAKPGSAQSRPQPSSPVRPKLASRLSGGGFESTSIP